MTYEFDCIFCQIVSGDRNADMVYQDDRVVAFNDINPKAPSHVLVVTRDHVESLNDAGPRDESLLGHLLRVTSKVANQVGIAEDGYRVVINTGENAGQSVPHLHVHVLGGRQMEWPPG